MAELVVKTAQQKHAIWQSYNALKRAGVRGAFQDNGWSLLVPGEAMKHVLFRVDC